MERSVRGALSALLLSAAASALLLLSPVDRAFAGDAPRVYARVAPVPAGAYFIDFRARPSSYIGHTYIIYGRLDGEGRVAEEHIAGLIPEHDVWEGLFVPIQANVREYKDDTKLLPVAIYRRQLSAAEYQRVARVVRYYQATEHRWHVIFQNCNTFAADLAEVLRLNRPPTVLPPSVWVEMLRKLNGG